MKISKLEKKSHPEIMVDHGRDHGVDFSRMADLPFRSSGGVAAALAGLEARPADVSTSIRVTWALIQWMRSGRPIFQMDDSLRDVLLATDVPAEPLDKIPEVPFDGFYLKVSGGFDLFDNQTGNHKVEGIYVCRDKLRRSADAEDPVEGLLVLAVGEDKGGVKPGLIRDDTLQYFGIIPGGSLTFKNAIQGTQEAMRVVINLLLLWNSEGSPIKTKTVTPSVPKSLGKRKKLERRGLSTVKYINLSLSKEWLTPQMNRSAVVGWDGPTHMVMVRGFFRRYWVTDAKGGQVLAERENPVGKRLLCVRRFVAPHQALRRGDAPESNTYVLR